MVDKIAPPLRRKGVKVWDRALGRRVALKIAQTHSERKHFDIAGGRTECLSFTFAPHKKRTVNNLIDVWEAPTLLDKLKSLGSSRGTALTLSKNRPRENDRGRAISFYGQSPTKSPTIKRDFKKDPASPLKQKTKRDTLNSNGRSILKKTSDTQVGKPVTCGSATSDIHTDADNTDSERSKSEVKLSSSEAKFEQIDQSNKREKPKRPAKGAAASTSEPTNSAKDMIKVEEGVNNDKVKEKKAKLKRQGTDESSSSLEESEVFT